MRERRVIRLERELQSKLKLTHAGSGTRRRVGFDVGDLSVAGTIDARATLIRIEA